MKTNQNNVIRLETIFNYRKLPAGQGLTGARGTC
jgi:hypothetical protein